MTPTNKGKIKFSNIIVNKLLTTFHLLSNRKNYYITEKYFDFKSKVKFLFKFNPSCKSLGFFCEKISGLKIFCPYCIIETILN